MHTHKAATTKSFAYIALGVALCTYSFGYAPTFADTSSNPIVCRNQQQERIPCLGAPTLETMNQPNSQPNPMIGVKLDAPLVPIDHQTTNAQKSLPGAGNLIAQVVPLQNLPPQQDIRPPSQPLPSPPSPLPSLPDPNHLLLLPNRSNPVLPETRPDHQDTIVVKRFEVLGSTVFRPEELAKITQPFTNRPLTLAELFQVRTAITELYVKKGYITSGAYIPPQPLNNGVVKIQVVEGTVEEILVKGTSKLKASYIRRRLAIAARAPLNRDRLMGALELLQVNPLLQTISAELTAGTTPGKSILTVEIKEAKTHNLQLTLDNGRSPSVGTARRQLQFTEANVLGFGDGFSFGFTNTDGSNAMDLNYTLPIGPYNTTLSLGFGYSRSRVIEAPFNILDITSASRSYEVTLRHPLRQSATQEFAIGLTGSRRETEASLLNGLIPFPTLGADDQGKTQISVLRFFQEYVRRSNQQVMALRSQFNLGIDVLGTTVRDSDPDSRFLTWRGQGQYVRLLAPDTLFLLRGDLQLADRPIVALEQFGLGGAQSVRGYRQDLLLADAGVFTSAEFRLPILRIPKLKALLQVTPFMDAGTVWNQGVRSQPSPNTIASVGLGLRLQVGDQLTAKLDWGIPLVNVNQPARTLQEEGVNFSLLYNLNF